jgi:CDGSH-type Zn-finger protein
LTAGTKQSYYVAKDQGEKFVDEQHSEKRKPIIDFTRFTPYHIVELETFLDHRGRELPVKPVMALCRCGASQRKPYCDGSHSAVGFVGDKSTDRVKDKLREYRGKEITILDNRGVCAHDKSCVRSLPSVFNLDRRPWIDPDGAGVREIIETIEKCPSGALSYRIGSVRYQNLDRNPLIRVDKNGPLKVEGYIELKDDMGSKPESREHYTLCRCGQAKNKPFCDGTHITVGFKDP